MICTIDRNQQVRESEEPCVCPNKIGKSQLRKLGNDPVNTTLVRVTTYLSGMMPELDDVGEHVEREFGQTATLHHPQVLFVTDHDRRVWETKVVSAHTPSDHRLVLHVKLENTALDDQFVRGQECVLAVPNIFTSARETVPLTHGCRKSSGKALFTCV